MRTALLFLTLLVAAAPNAPTAPAAARAFMQSGPAVIDGAMTAELHPYAVALQRK